MKIIIPGGSGQIGSLLARAFIQRYHHVVILSRQPGPHLSGTRTLLWDGFSPGAWTDEINGADVVINLAGRSVNCRYHPRNRQLILDSRVQSTEAIGRAIQNAPRPPRLWLQASTATLYSHRYDAPNDDLTGQLGGEEPYVPETWRFSIQVAQAWEAAALRYATPKTRLVLMRSAMTMSPDPGGVFSVLRRLVRLGLGGWQGDGRQFVSWIHETDFIESLLWIMAKEELSGPVNLASPHPIPNRQFMRDLRKACGVPIGLPAMGWMIEIGAFALRTESELILKSRRVIPTRLLQSGFSFKYPHWPEASAELANRASLQGLR